MNTSEIIDPGKYTFATLFYLIQRAEIFLGHQVAIMLQGDFMGYIINCESDEEPIFYFENIRQLFEFLVEAGNCKN
jgi:hypothetical protein